MLELLMVRIRREQRSENGRARGDERPPRPPDVEPVWRGKGVIGVRSRKLSIPISAIGSQRSIRRVSGIRQ